MAAATTKKADKAPAKKTTKKADEPDLTAERMVARSLHVDHTTTPNEPHNIPVSGGMVEVVDGPHKGRVGVFMRALTADPGSAVPKRILVRTRDADHMRIEVDFADCVATRKGRQ